MSCLSLITKGFLEIQVSKSLTGFTLALPSKLDLLISPAHMIILNYYLE